MQNKKVEPLLYFVYSYVLHSNEEWYVAKYSEKQKAIQRKNELEDKNKNAFMSYFVKVLYNNMTFEDLEE